MAYDIVSDMTGNLPASADLSATPYRFVTLNGSGLWALTGAGARADGVLYVGGTAAGEPCDVKHGRILKVEVGTGGLTAGANVASAANGLAVVAGSGDEINGIALAAEAAGAIASIFIPPTSRGAVA